MRYFRLLLLLITFAFFGLGIATISAQTIPQNPYKTDSEGLRQGKWTILCDKDCNIITDASKAKF